jgi:DNA ligase (NAD+)
LTNKEFLISLYGIWDITVQTISNYFSDKSKQKLLYRLLEAEYQFVCETGNLREKEHFSITGTFVVSREIITQAFQKEWYVFDENPTKTTNFMLIWDKAGSKKEKAESMNIKLYTDREQLKKEFPFLNSLSISAPKKQTPQISQQSLF